MKSRLLFLLMATLLMLAACGSDSGTTSTTSAPDAAPTTVAAETTTTVTEPAPTTTTSLAGTEPGDGIPAELAAALSQTTDVTSGRMEGSFEMIGIEGLPSGTSLVLPFSGAFDNEAGIFTFTMDMSGMAGSLGEEVPPELADMFGVMEVRQIGETTYMSWPFFSFLGVQTPWISMPSDEGGFATDDLTPGGTPANPADFLSLFEDTNATITEIGREAVRGVETTHYLAVFDTESLTPEQRAELEAQGGAVPLEEMPMDIWIGDDGLVYRYVVDLTGDTVEASPGEGFERMVMTFEMFDWGEDIDVEAPPADQVTDASELEALFGP